jgi:zinc protease
MTLPRLIVAVLLGASLVTPAMAGGQSLDSRLRGNDIEKITTVEGITEYRLANGLKVLLFPDPSKATITINITYLVGSRHENYGETGMAHLLEHLLFKGTPKNPDIDKQLNARGARANGTTWLDRTNYYEIVQATEENLRWAIELEADRMVNSLIARKDLESEMTVVRNEYEQGENSPFQVLLKRLQSVAYDWHSYGRSTIGNRSDIENVGIENLRAFYRTYYQPDNAVLLIAGKFDEAKALEMVAKAFGSIPKPERKLPVLWTVEPTQDGEREFRIRRKGDIQIVTVAYKVPSALHEHGDGVAFANFVLGDVPTGRLHKALVETGKASQTFAYMLTGVDPGLHVFGAVWKKGESVDAALETLVKTVEGLAKEPPTKEEVDRARKYYANQIEKSLNNPESVGVQLSEYIALGDWRLLFQARDDLEKASPEAVAKVAAAYYRRDNRTMGYFVPEDHPLRAEIPPAPAVAEVMKDFKGKAATTAAEAFEPSQDNINARTRRFAILGGDVKPLPPTEAPGVRVALLPKKNRGETVNVSFALRIGNEKDLFGQQLAARMAGAMLSRGTTRFTRQQLADEVERLKISGRIAGPGASFQTTRPNLEEALRLAVHVQREPTFPDSEFVQLQNQMVTGILAAMSDPSARASDAMNKHFLDYPRGDWRYAPSLEESLEDVKAITLEQVKRFHRDFYGASVAEVAVVGDFDPAAVEALLRELFGNWPAATPYVRVDAREREVASTSVSLETPDKENAVLLARHNLSMRDDDPDYPALLVADHILGGGTGLDSRLVARIRGKDGLSYGVGSTLSVGSTDRAAHWSVYAIAAPQNIPRVEKAMVEELERALKEGVTEAELAAAKSGILQVRAQNRAQDGTIAGAWVGLLNLGRTFDYSKRMEERIAALKAEDVNAALRKYLSPARLSTFKAGNFAGK